MPNQPLRDQVFAVLKDDSLQAHPEVELEFLRERRLESQRAVKKGRYLEPWREGDPKDDLQEIESRLEDCKRRVSVLSPGETLGARRRALDAMSDTDVLDLLKSLTNDRSVRLELARAELHKCMRRMLAALSGLAASSQRSLARDRGLADEAAKFSVVFPEFAKAWYTKKTRQESNKRAGEEATKRTADRAEEIGNYAEAFALKSGIKLERRGVKRLAEALLSDREAVRSLTKIMNKDRDPEKPAKKPPGITVLRDIIGERLKRLQGFCETEV